MDISLRNTAGNVYDPGHCGLRRTDQNEYNLRESFDNTCIRNRNASQRTKNHLNQGSRSHRHKICDGGCNHQNTTCRVS